MPDPARTDPTPADPPRTAPENPEDEHEPGDYGAADPEAPEADVAEQLAELRQRDESPQVDDELREADPADAAEQSRVVELDEEDYR
jgi:hypothetical protein